MIGPAPEEWGIALERAGASTGGRTRVGRVCSPARACTVLFGLLLLGAAGAAAQATPDTARAGAPSDTMRQAAVDTTRRTSTDTSGAGRAAATGVFAPAPAATPSAGSPSPTSAAPGGVPPQVGPAPSAVSVGPSDTVLARACQGMAAGTQAPGLLTVMFRAGTSDRDRAAAAKSVGGTLGGPTAYGEEYVVLPPDAGPLPVVADRLIRQDPVTQVSPAPCPPTEETSTPSPSATAIPPTGAAGAPTPPTVTDAPPDTSRAPAPAGAPKESP